MRTLKSRTLIAAAVLIFAGTGCTDLLVEPKSSVTGANVFNDVASYRSFLAKIYGGMAVPGQGATDCGLICRPNWHGVRHVADTLSRRQTIITFT